MCLTLNIHEHGHPLPDTLPLPRISCGPLLVWKALEYAKDIGKYVSPYYNKHTWEFGMPHTAEFEFSRGAFNKHIDIDSGLHSFRTRKRATHELRDWGDTHFVFPAIIPTGTPFYIGIDLDIVSAELIVYEDMDALYLDVKEMRHTECAAVHYSYFGNPK